jgi:cell division protein ZapA
MPAQGGGVEEVVVTVLGETYKLRGQGGLGHLKQVALLVEARVDEVTKEYPQASPTRAVVLAALNVADELCRERELKLREEEGREASLRSMIEALETELVTTPGEEETSRAQLEPIPSQADSPENQIG